MDHVICYDVITLVDYNYSESLSTLQFANRAKNIENTTKKNEVY